MLKKKKKNKDNLIYAKIIISCLLFSSPNLLGMSKNNETFFFTESKDIIKIINYQHKLVQHNIYIYRKFNKIRKIRIT